MKPGSFTAERLLALYDRVSDAEDAIPRLRRFVLDLAVRGKLTERGVLDGETRTLGSVAEFVMGQAPPGEACNATGVGTLFVKVGEFGERYPEHRAWTTQPLKFAKTGDVLICVVGATVGKLNLGVDCAIGRSVAAIRPNQQKLATEYLYYSLMPFTLGLREGARGSAQGVISKPDLAKLHVWLPPLAEQHRIVAKVDELMALCDRLEAARAEREALRDRLTAATLARLTAPEAEGETFADHARFALDTLPNLTTRPDQTKTLRQTILNLAVRGKLVKQDRDDKLAADLLHRIAQERNAAKSKTRHRTPQHELNKLVAESELPLKWVWADIDQIAISMRYGTSIKCEAKTEGAPVLRIPNVSGGTVSLDDMKYGSLSPSEIDDLALRSGDILMIRSNGSLDIVGRSAVVPAEAIGMAFAGYLVRLRLSPSLICAHYIWLVLNSSDVREQIEKPIRSAVGLKNINLTEFGNLKVPLPPLAEQHRIVAKVESLMALCDQLEASLTAASATRTRLLDALLHEALAQNSEQEIAACH